MTSPNNPRSDGQQTALAPVRYGEVERQFGRQTPATNSEARRAHNQIRHAKMELVSAIMRLDELGVDVTKIDLRAVIAFGRGLSDI